MELDEEKELGIKICLSYLLLFALVTRTFLSFSKIHLDDMVLATLLIMKKKENFVKANKCKNKAK